MSIFDSLLRPSEKERVKNKKQSEQVISELIGDQDKFMDMSSHSEYLDLTTKKVMPNTYKFTVKLLSLAFLDKISKDRRVKNVYFASRHSHPGGSVDGISLRQRIIIEYY